MILMNEIKSYRVLRFFALKEENQCTPQLQVGNLEILLYFFSISIIQPTFLDIFQLQIFKFRFYCYENMFRYF